MWSALSTARPEDFAWGDIALWSGVLIALSLVGLLIILWAKRSLTISDEGEEADGFTLHGLRLLHRNGQLTDEEFKRAKETLIERIKAKTAGADSDEEAMPDKSPPTDETD